MQSSLYDRRASCGVVDDEPPYLASPNYREATPSMPCMLRHRPTILVRAVIPVPSESSRTCVFMRLISTDLSSGILNVARYGESHFTSLGLDSDLIRSSSLVDQTTQL